MTSILPFDLARKKDLTKLRCVECYTALSLANPNILVCKNNHTFNVINNVPILLSKNSKITIRKSLATKSARSMRSEYELSKKTMLKQFIKTITTVPNVSIEMFDSQKLFDKVTQNEDPKLFVVSIGGGPFRDRKTIINLNIDIYPNVEIVGDAHNLPFKNNSLDGVVINAVLEHLEYPELAVQEIYRVLKKGGYVIAETPFLQHYHGYPSHFQNYTLTGHNYLFRQFKILESGAIVGPFSTIVTLIMNLPEDLITNKYVRKITLYFLGLILLPLRYIDVFFKKNPNIFKITGGVYLFAQKQ